VHKEGQLRKAAAHLRGSVITEAMMEIFLKREGVDS
jgi:hypothetical protein